MSIPIHSDQNKQSIADAASAMDKRHQLDLRLEDTSDQIEIEKKKRPEDITPSLAQIAQVVWDKQPNEVRTYSENNFESNLQLNSIPTASRSGHIFQEAKNQLFDSSLVTAQFFDIAHNSRVQPLSILANEINSAPSEQIQRTPSLKSENGVKDLSAVDVFNQSGSESADSAKSRVSDNSLHIGVSDSGVPVAANYKSGSQEKSASSNRLQANGLDVQAGNGSVVNEVGSEPKLKNDADSFLTGFGSSRDAKKAEVGDEVDSGSPLTVMNQINNSSNVVVTSPQKTLTGSSTTRPTIKSKAEPASQNKSAEGINYKFSSWGSGNNSVQITGSSKSGYKALSSNGEVGGVLEKYLPEDGSLSLTITASETTGSSQQEDSPLNLDKHIDQS